MLLLASCSKMGPLSADNFSVDPNPLEAIGGKVPATIDGTFPVKYMKKKAVVTVTPELRYGNGLVTKGNGATFQGEKVQGNNQTISYKMGGKYTMKTAFPYNADMAQSEMYLTFDARKGNKVYNVPAVKVANGVIATAELYKKTMDNAGACIAPDSFQRIKDQKVQANVKFLINQANLRKSELKNNSVKEFVKMLQSINADRKGLNMKNVEVAAYASPDGGFAFNDKLSKNREKVSTKYVNKQLKAATGILPELRRSRLIINYQTVGRSDDEINEQYAADPSKLSEDELLYAASLTNDASKKAEIYQKASELNNTDYRSLNNLAALAFNRGDMNAAKQYIAEAQTKGNAPEAYANLALIALKNGNTSEAESYIAKANDANGLSEVLGNLNIAKGDYAQAVKNFGSSATNSAALAQLLTKDYATALSTLNNVKNADGMTEYLKAIVNNRMGNTSAAKAALNKAKKLDKTLAAYASKDLELANLK